MTAEEQKAEESKKIAAEANAKAAAALAKGAAETADAAARAAGEAQRQAAGAAKEDEESKASIDDGFSGIVGGPVAIYGRGLGSGGQLTINGVFTQATSWRDTCIKAVVPGYLKPGPATAVIAGSGVTGTGRLVR